MDRCRRLHRPEQRHYQRLRRDGQTEQPGVLPRTQASNRRFSWPSSSTMGRLCTVALEELIAFCFLPSITASLCRLPFEVLDLEAGDIFRFESIAKGMAR